MILSFSKENSRKTYWRCTMLPENVDAVNGIIQTLTPRIIGRELPSSSCDCGEYVHAAATAVEIKPAGMANPGQETMWFLWIVWMEPKPDEQGTGWGSGLDQFL